MQANQKKQLLMLAGLLAVLVLVVAVFLIPAYRRQTPQATPAPSEPQQETKVATAPAAPAGAEVAAAPEEELPPPPRVYMGGEPFTDPQTAARAAAGKAPPTPGTARPPAVVEVPPGVPPPLGPPTGPPAFGGPVVELPSGAAEPAIWYYQQASPLRIEPFMPVASRPLPPPTPALEWTVTGIVIGPKRTAVISDGQRSYIVEQGAVVRKIGGAEVVAQEVGSDYVKLRYRNRVVTLRLREGS